MGAEVQDNLKNSIVEHAKDYGINSNDRAANVINGGQLGVGYQPDTIDAATPLVFTPTHLVVMHTPTMFDSNPKIGQAIKALIETHPKSVSGIDFGYSVETESTIFGNDGQEMEIPKSTKRSAVSPSFTFQELTGNVVWNIFKNWVFNLSHPDTNAAFSDNKDALPFMTSTYSMSMLAIQYDPTQVADNIIDGAYYTNMFPKGTGELGLERTPGQSKIMERSVEFSAIVFHNYYTKLMAIEHAKALNIKSINYNIVKTGLTQVEKKLDGSGLALGVDRIIKLQEDKALV